MMHDTVIRGGTIVDGAGGEPFIGDVAIDRGVITVVGAVEQSGRREIDATGHVVSPGFIDLHTHLDAQIGWDPALTPISWHGVTTALIGNCGLTFAPCKPEDRATLAGMMETVEDIPGDAILSGLPWTWEAYEEYLDTLQNIRPGINVAGLIGHCALRYYVMGDRSFAGVASDEELAQMCALVDRAMAKGALGLSSNRFEQHKAPDGRAIPGTYAPISELVALSKEVAKHDGVVQLVGARKSDLIAISDEGGARVLFSYSVGPNEGDGQRAVKLVEDLCSTGRDITALTHVRGSGVLLNLQGSLPFTGAAWDELKAMDATGRLSAVNDSSFVARLLADAEPLRPADEMFYLGNGETPVYSAPGELNLEAMAEQSGESTAAVFLRLCRETNGRASFMCRMFAQNLDELAELISNEHAFASLGDSGAHVCQVMDGDWATFLLTYWVRERGLFTLPEAVRMMTSASARLLGLADRGLIAPGMRADINVFNFERLGQHHPVVVYDLPGGAARYIQRGRGYHAVLVNGELSLSDDELTGTRAGEVLRPKRELVDA